LCDSFAPIEAVLTRLAHKASKEVPTKSGAKMARKGGVESYEHSFLIYDRANAECKHMGLTTWAASPSGKILKGDVSVAKNYLTEAELQDLGLLVNAYLDLAERRARQKAPMLMEDWAKHLDLILQADGNALLQNAGAISAEIAKKHAEGEYEKYRVVQDRLFQSDFDRQMQLLKHEMTY